MTKKLFKKIFMMSSQFLLVYSLLINSEAAVDLPKNSPTPAPNEFPPALEATHEESHAVPEYVILRPSDQVTFSSETTASVAVINVKEGSSFKKGDILIKLDCRIQVAELKKAQAQLQVADMAYKSALKLKNYGLISELELTQASAQQQIAKADVDKLLAVVEKCVIRAPFQGAVSALLVFTHETVKPGDPLLKIVNTTNLTFALQVPSSWLTWLRINSAFFVRINETQQLIPAVITKINPEIDSVSQTVKIEGEITEPDESLRPGMSGQAQFTDNPANKNLLRKKGI